MQRLGLCVICIGVAALLLAPGAQAAYQFQTAWGSIGSAPGQFNGPLLTATGPDGSVYVADAGNNRVQKFTADGAFVTSWGGTGSAAGQFNLPVGVAVAPDNSSVYVTDRSNNRVQQFDVNGAFLGQWGTPGALDGQFNAPTGIAVGPDGSVFVGDSGNARIQKFTSNGAHIVSFGIGVVGDVQGLAAGPDGSVYSTDDSAHRVEHFDANGVFQGSWGTQGAGDGQFQAPRGIAATSLGVYVADNAPQGRVEKFTSGGAFVDSFDASSAGDPQLSGAFGIAISSTGQIYVSQNSTSRIARYGETTAGGGGSLPPPQTGVTANAVPVNGTVKVKRPGSNTFELLAAGEQIPIGSIVDVTNGTVALTTTSGPTGTQSANFFSGVFKLTQDKSARPVTELQLFGGNFKRACGSAGRAVISATRKKKVVRQLWGSGKGRFRTKGRFAAATVRGTDWLTQDRCDGTNVRVKQGAVTVRDLVKKRNVVVRAPRSYLALAKRARRP